MVFSALLGSLIALSTMNANSEIVSMKAAGASAHQILAPLILASFVIALLLFAFNERVVAPSYATLTAWEAVEYGPIPEEERVRTNIYLNDNGNILTAGYLAGSGEGIVIERAPSQ